MNEKHPIKKIKILDIMPVAVMFDDYFGKYLVPPPDGAYLRGALKPSLVPGGVYYQQLIVDDSSGGGQAMTIPVSLDALDQIESAVYDDSAQLVVPHYAASLLSATPTIPVSAINLIVELLNLELTKLQAWPMHSFLAEPNASLEEEYDVIVRYLNQNALRELASRNEVFTGTSNRVDVTVDLFEEMLRCMSVLRKRLSSFVGEDNWTVHFMEVLPHAALQVAKSVDYRIIDWHERNGVPLDY